MVSRGALLTFYSIYGDWIGAILASTIVGRAVSLFGVGGQAVSLPYYLLCKTQMNDPDIGKWDNQHDASGPPIHQTDARGQLLLMSHAALECSARKQTSAA
jgi:hypothetical protein